MDDLVARMVAGSGRQASKTKTYEKLRPAIEVALANKASIRGIHRALTDAGYSMGSIRWFTLWVNQSGITIGANASPARTVAEPASAISPVGDQRFKPDFE